MSGESSDHVAPPPKFKSDFTLPTQTEIGKTYFEWYSEVIQSQLPTDILLLTANDNEFNACYSYMKQDVQDVQRSWCDRLGMVDFSKFGETKNVKVTLMKCAQGPIEAVLAVINAAEILKPKVALFVGLCATMKPEKAKLGDVVISAKLATYDHKKVKADGTKEYRNVKANASKNMSRLILSAKDGWQPPLEDSTESSKVEVHRAAVMLSGSELVNNRERREELHRDFPEALGLEMEGAGLYAGAYDLDIEWAVIKGVSDFAENKDGTDIWQPFASAMAASVVYNMFKNPDVIKNWPHYKKSEDTYAVPPTKGERNGHKIEYSVTKREVYVGNAKDVETGKMVETQHCFTKETALHRAIEDLFK